VSNIVLAHGADTDCTTWRPMYERLVADDYHVTVVQLPMTNPDEVAALIRQAAAAVK